MPAPSLQEVGIVVDDEVHWVRAERHSRYLVFEGDILLDVSGPAADLGTTYSALHSISELDALWPQARVPYVIDDGVPSRGEIEDAIAHWNGSTEVELVARTDEEDYVYFVPDEDRCASFVGRQGGRQEILLAPGCRTAAVIHEIGHAIGLYHEHTRADRDDHVVIHWDEILEGREHNFEQRAFGSRLGAYHHRSIMHYSSSAFAVDADPTITTREGEHVAPSDYLTEGDLDGIALMFWRADGAAFVPSSTETATSQILFEAEAFDDSETRAGDRWITDDDPGAAEGEVVTTPDTGRSYVSRYWEFSPELRYRVDVEESGAYRIWVRGFGQPNSNSVHVGVDGSSELFGEGLDFPNGEFSWTGSQEFELGRGRPSIHLWAREDGTRIDRILLQRSAAEAPEGVGPMPSPRSEPER